MFRLCEEGIPELDVVVVVPLVGPGLGTIGDVDKTVSSFMQECSIHCCS